jgi:hypothetical protein
MRDYFLISILLVGGGLTLSGMVEIYYRYQESREQLALLQKEIASGAASKIEAFVQEIHNILRGATKSREIAPRGLTPEFRFELEKLLLIAPAITEAIALNENGAIQVQASRLRTVLPDGKKDLSIAESFKHQTRQSLFRSGPLCPRVRTLHDHRRADRALRRRRDRRASGRGQSQIHRRRDIEHHRRQSRLCLRRQPHR